MSYYPQQYAISAQGYPAVQPKQGAAQMWRSAGNRVNAVNYWRNPGAARKSVASNKSTATPKSISTIKSVPSTAASTAASSSKGVVKGDWYAKWYHGGARKLPADTVVEGMEGVFFKAHESGKSKGDLAKEQADKRARVEAWRKKAGKNYKNYEY